jgi:hypothetical protein
MLAQPGFCATDGRNRLAGILSVTECYGEISKNPLQGATASDFIPVQYYAIVELRFKWYTQY